MNESTLNKDIDKNILRIRSICYESTKKCNLNCEYCIASDNEYYSKDDDYGKIIKFMAEINPERIVISGGEPLLDTNLVDKLSMIRNSCINSYISLSTNGSLKYELDNLKGLIDCIDISLPTLNPKLYALMRGKNLVDIVKTTIKNAIAMLFNVRISIVLSKVNVSDLMNILEYANKVGVNSVRIGRFLPFRNAACVKNKYELSDDAIKKTMEEVKRVKFNFNIIPPILDLSIMEAGYINVNYLGEVFLPTSKGKVICGNTSDANKNMWEKIAEVQKSIFLNMEEKSGIKK